jgi:hypothetical protein
VPANVVADEEEEEIIPQEENANEAEPQDKEIIIKEFAEQVLKQLRKRGDRFGFAHIPQPLNQNETQRAHTD